MYRSYADTGGNVNEEIKLLNSISHVSARLARNLSLLAASQSEEGGKENVKNGRNGTDHRRAPHRCCLPSSKLAAPMPVFIRTANGKQITKVRRLPVSQSALITLSERTA